MRVNGTLNGTNHPPCKTCSWPTWSSICPLRLQRLVSSVRAHFSCGAVALLQLEEDHLRPVAVDGLTQDAGPLRGAAASRLAAILARRGHLLPSRQHPARPVRPDQRHGRRAPAGARLHGHQPACRGPALGVLTLDALGSAPSAPRPSPRRELMLVEAAHHAAGGRDARAAPDAGQSRADGTPADNHEILGQSGHRPPAARDRRGGGLGTAHPAAGRDRRNCSRTACTGCRAAAPSRWCVNCAALPESLAESELFGHAKGAFSARWPTGRRGRQRRHPVPGRSRRTAAAGAGQAAARAERRDPAPGRRPSPARGRGRHQPQPEGPGARRFRADLYHRLSVYPIAIRRCARGNDVLLLAGRYLEQNRARLGLRSLRLALDAEALRRYRWPGNVRELEHVISRAAIRR